MAAGRTIQEEKNSVHSDLIEIRSLANNLRQEISQKIPRAIPAEVLLTEEIGKLSIDLKTEKFTQEQEDRLIARITSKKGTAAPLREYFQLRREIHNFEIQINQFSTHATDLENLKAILKSIDPEKDSIRGIRDKIENARKELEAKNLQNVTEDFFRALNLFEINLAKEINRQILPHQNKPKDFIETESNPELTFENTLRNLRKNISDVISKLESRDRQDEPTWFKSKKDINDFFEKIKDQVNFLLPSNNKLYSSINALLHHLQKLELLRFLIKDKNVKKILQEPKPENEYYLGLSAEEFNQIHRQWANRAIKDVETPRPEPVKDLKSVASAQVFQVPQYVPVYSAGPGPGPTIAAPGLRYDLPVPTSEEIHSPSTQSTIVPDSIAAKGAGAVDSAVAVAVAVAVTAPAISAHREIIRPSVITIEPHSPLDEEDSPSHQSINFNSLTDTEVDSPKNPPVTEDHSEDEEDNSRAAVTPKRRRPPVLKQNYESENVSSRNTDKASAPSKTRENLEHNSIIEKFEKLRRLIPKNISDNPNKDAIARGIIDNAIKEINEKNFKNLEDYLNKLNAYFASLWRRERLFERASSAITDIRRAIQEKVQVPGDAPMVESRSRAENMYPSVNRRQDQPTAPTATIHPANNRRKDMLSSRDSIHPNSLEAKRNQSPDPQAVPVSPVVTSRVVPSIENKIPNASNNDLSSETTVESHQELLKELNQNIKSFILDLATNIKSKYLSDLNAKVNGGNDIHDLAEDIRKACLNILPKQCDVFLMSDSDEDEKESNNHFLYLYKEQPLGNIFYVINVNGQKERQYLDEIKFPENTKFPTRERFIQYDNLDIIEKVLIETAQRGHTQQSLRSLGVSHLSELKGNDERLSPDQKTALLLLRTLTFRDYVATHKIDPVRTKVPNPKNIDAYNNWVERSHRHYNLNQHFKVRPSSSSSTKPDVPTRGEVIAAGAATLMPAAVGTTTGLIMAGTIGFSGTGVVPLIAATLTLTGPVGWCILGICGIAALVGGYFTAKWASQRSKAANEVQRITTTSGRNSPTRLERDDEVNADGKDDDNEVQQHTQARSLPKVSGSRRESEVSIIFPGQPSRSVSPESSPQLRLASPGSPESKRHSSRGSVATFRGLPQSRSCGQGFDELNTQILDDSDNESSPSNQGAQENSSRVTKRR